MTIWSKGFWIIATAIATEPGITVAYSRAAAQGFTRTFEVDLICDLAVQAASSSAKPRQIKLDL
jgi:hypothetical protein